MRSEGSATNGGDQESSRSQGRTTSEENSPDAEQRNIRRLQVMMNLVLSVIAQDKNLTVDQAAEIVASSKKAALDMFPDKEVAFNLIYRPRIQRLMRERFRIQ